MLRFLIVMGFLVAVLVSGGLRAQSAGDVEISAISGSLDQPRRHFRLRRAADLEPARASEIYAIVADAMARGYARAGPGATRDFRNWQRHNAAPYRSATHGNHYLNNYVNAIGEAYGCIPEGGQMPVGTIIAKDSFAVTESGGILLGPLFVMEKMGPDFNYVSGDWRYTLILPDGQVLGTTRGDGAARVGYCIACHLAVEQQDHLYGVPEAARARPCQ